MTWRGWMVQIVLVHPTTSAVAVRFQATRKVTSMKSFKTMKQLQHLSTLFASHMWIKTTIMIIVSSKNSLSDDFSEWRFFFVTIFLSDDFSNFQIFQTLNKRNTFRFKIKKGQIQVQPSWTWNQWNLFPPLILRQKILYLPQFQRPRFVPVLLEPVKRMVVVAQVVLVPCPFVQRMNLLTMIWISTLHPSRCVIQLWIHTINTFQP